MHKTVIGSIFLLLMLFGVGHSLSASVRFSGGVQLRANLQELEIFVERIDSVVLTGSPRFRIQLWQVPSFYSGGDIRGEVLAQFEVTGTAAEMRQVENLRRVFALPTLPDGAFNLVLTLSEYKGDKYLIRDHRSFANRLVLNQVVRARGLQFQEIQSVGSAFVGAIQIAPAWWIDSALDLIYAPNGNWFHLRRYNRWYFFNSPGTWEEGLWIYDVRYASWAFSRRSWYPSVWYERFGEWRQTGFR